VRSLGAVVVGIGAYRYTRPEFPQLRYAANDASSIVEYIKACWPTEGDARVVHIDEDRATGAAISEAFRTLEEGGDYDMQLVFLSGHGVADASTAGFVIQPPDGISDISLLDFAELDRVLESVSAQRTILVLDCCNAEGIVRRMRFFNGLGRSDARLFIASSRELQLTWEDDRIQHGIFTAHLLDLLNNGSSIQLGGVRKHLDVDSELFPVLCQQVPLYVFEHKQQRQEPVKGGISIRAVSLPVAQSARRIKERTAFGTAMRRLRQMVGTIASACMVFLFLAYVLAYYAEADRNGSIRLRHGIKWLAPLFRPFPTLRADTGIPTMALSDDPAMSYAIRTGALSGFWTQVSTQEYRAWYDKVCVSLSPESAARYDVLIGAGTKPPVEHLSDASRPSEVAFAAWALLDNADPKSLDTLLAHLPGPSVPM
jgi:Caspase domain